MATTKEQVWLAADTIASEGGNPTLAAVREHLGGGSYTDISAAMQQWRASRQSSSAPMREPAPATITERMGEFSSEIWAVALEMANTRLQSEREGLEVARKEAEDTRQEAADLADQADRFRVGQMQRWRDVGGGGFVQPVNRLAGCAGEIFTQIGTERQQEIHAGRVRQKRLANRTDTLANLRQQRGDPVQAGRRKIQFCLTQCVAKADMFADLAVGVIL